MKTKFRPDVVAAAMVTSFMWSTPASATGIFRDIFCSFFRCGGGGGGGGGGASPVPEIDAGAGLAAVALVVSVAAVAYRKYSK
jgi:hypothetical protein